MTNIPLLHQIKPALKLSESIALVGSAPRLLKAEHGSTIDRFSDVIRLNDATPKARERHAGSRTTVRFVGRAVRSDTAPDGERHGKLRSSIRDALSGEAVIGRKGNIEFLRELSIPSLYEWSDYRSYVRGCHDFIQGKLGLSYMLPESGKPFRSGTLLLANLVASVPKGFRIGVFGFSLPGEASGARYYGKGPTQIKLEDSHADIELEAEVFQKICKKYGVEIY